MREMKDSGIEWIGDIPSNWNLIALRYLIKESFSGSWGEDSKNNDKDRICMRIADFDYSKMMFKNQDESLFTVRNYSTKDIASKTLKYGDLLIEKSGGGEKTPVGRAVIFRENFQAIFANFMNCLRFKKIINFEFVKYLFYSLYQRRVTTFYINQTIGIQNLNCERFYREIKLPVPDLAIQQKIADFLDKKCAEIDSLSADIQNQIDTLEEYKKSVITEAVTKGLNPNVEMKESGIMGIPQIPSHWEIKPFQFLLKERNIKNTPIVTKERLSLSIDKGVTLYSEKTTNLDRFKEDVSLYKIAKSGDFVLNSMNMIVGAVGIAPCLGCVSPAYYVYFDISTDNVYTKYCNYLFHTRPMLQRLFRLGKGIMAYVRGDDRVNTCRLKVSRYDLNKLKIPVPPKEEVLQIIKHLEKINASIEKTISEKQQQLETLEEYKKSLIYEYVTGKKEVV